MKKLLGLALVTALCAVLLCTGAMADEVGDFTVTGDTEDENYSYAGGVLTIKTGTPLTIKNTDSSKSTTDRIVIGSGVTANLTFAGVNISLGVNENTNGVSAVTVPSGATLHLTLADGSVNTLVGDTNGGSSNSGAGIEAPKGATLTISCAHSGDNGHVCSENCGSLSASGAAWGVANGCAAGIGGKQAAGGTITINGGNIEATGGRGAGIGGGGMDRPCTGGTIVINGGIVEAQGGLESAGIGGSAASSGNITINGGTVTARSFVLVSSVGGAGIGAGEGTHDPSGEITITGGTVTAYGTDGGAGIGGGCFNAVSKISISGGTVMAYGAGGAGIGSGSGSIYGYGGDITITGGAVTAYGAWGGAGIGGGRSGNGGDITISGGTVIACGGEYTGNYESEEYYGPSGIGSGGFYVDTEDDETYNTEKPKPGTFSTGESGSAIIFAYGGRGKDGAGEAFSAGDTSGWSGLIFQGVAESYEDGLPKELSASEG